MLILDKFGSYPQKCCPDLFMFLLAFLSAQNTAHYVVKKNQVVTRGSNPVIQYPIMGSNKLPEDTKLTKLGNPRLKLPPV